MRPTGSQYKYSHSEKYSLSSANHSRGKTMLKFIVQKCLQPTHLLVVVDVRLSTN